MKIMIEVSGGVVQNITATDEVSIYLIDHDDLRDSGINTGPYGSKCAQQPDCIYWDETDFDEALEQVLSEYENTEAWEPEEVRDYA